MNEWPWTFNGFVAQGIDLDWQLHTLPIEFDFMDGNYFKLLN